MKASERLRALDGAMTPGPWYEGKTWREGGQMNLNEIHYSENADDAEVWAARREFGLRYDSYREAMLREEGIREMLAPHSIAALHLLGASEEWIHSVRAELLDA